MAPSSIAETKLIAGAKLQSFSYTTLSKPFLNWYWLMVMPCSQLHCSKVWRTKQQNYTVSQKMSLL